MGKFRRFERRPLVTVEVCLHRLGSERYFRVLLQALQFVNLHHKHAAIIFSLMY